MLYHLLFTGSVRKDVSKFVEQTSIERIRNASARLQITGRMLYADGNFLLILEGAKDNIHALYTAFSTHPSLSKPLILAEKPTEHRVFDHFQLSFGRKDMDAPIHNPVFLSRQSVSDCLNDNSPEYITQIVESFLRVQRVA